MEKQPWLQLYGNLVPKHFEIPAIPLNDILCKSAKQFSTHVCIEFEGNSLAYKEIWQSANKFARGLLVSGAQKGDRIALVLPNIPEFVVAYYGIMMMGGVVVPINPATPYNELINLCKKVDIREIIGEINNQEILVHAELELGIRLLIIVEGNNTSKKGEQKENRLERSINFEELITSKNDDIPLEDNKPEDTAMLQFSGGTTGEAKAIVVSHKNLVANTLQLRYWFSSLENGKENFLVCIPLTHVYGMVIGLNLGIAMGATIHLLKSGRDPNKILETIEKHKISFFPAVPTIYYAITQVPEVKSGHFDLHSIKACISGSAPLDPLVRKNFEELTGGRLVEGYGLSEAPTATHCNSILIGNRNGSIGLPLPDVDCKIETNDSPDGSGELLIRSPQVMSGYLDQPDETDRVLKDGWLHTGDIVRMDSDGYFYILGRIKEMIKVSGFQVWPREIEEILMKDPKIQEAAVAGVFDPAKGERVKAWIVMKKGEKETPEEILDFCKKYLIYYKVPSEIVFISELPKTPVGKVLRRELK